MARVKIVFMVSMRFEDEQDRLVGSFTCKKTVRMEFSERPRVGEDFFFASVSDPGESLLGDMTKVTSVSINMVGDKVSLVEVNMEGLNMGHATKKSAEKAKAEIQQAGWEIFQLPK